MRVKSDVTVWKFFRNILIACGLTLILFPLYLVVINSFKSLEEAGRNFFALPSTLRPDNFIELFTNSNYWIFLRNSLKITVISVALILIFVPSVSYAIARNFERKYYKTVYFYLLMGLFIPSQVIMLPVTKMMTKLNLLNHEGLIVLYTAFSLTQGVFLFVNNDGADKDIGYRMDISVEQVKDHQPQHTGDSGAAAPQADDRQHDEDMAEMQKRRTDGGRQGDAEGLDP